MRSIACLVLVVACTNKPAPTPTPAPVASAKTDERAMTIVIETCLPVGYGEHCSGTIEPNAGANSACRGTGRGRAVRRASSPAAGRHA